MSVTEIARSLNRPRTTISNRLERLERSGFIKGYSAIIDFDKMGFSLKAYVFLVAKRGGVRDQYRLAKDVIKAVEGDKGIWIEEIHIVSGRYDLLLKVRFKELDDLTRLLIKHLAAFSEIEHSETFIVLQTVEEGRVWSALAPPWLHSLRESFSSISTRSG